MYRRIPLALCISAFAVAPSHAQDASAVRIPVPKHYVVKHHCMPDRGFVAVAEAPGYPSTYPKLNLLVFKGEVIGVLFEAEEKDGWKPWYNQPEGKATSHDGSPSHYTQTLMFKKGPTAQECKAATAR